MHSEAELREAMRASVNVTPTGIDTEAVMRKARARRVPKRIAFSSLSVLAVAGVVTLGVTSMPALLPGQSGASDSAVMATAPESAQYAGAGGSESELSRAEKAQPNLCGMPTVRAESHPAGLALSASFPASAPADGEEITGVVSLTNSGTARVSGTTAAAPVIIVSRNGITVWRSHGMMVTAVEHLDLGPGESFSYDARFTPVECGPRDEIEGQFRDDLPPLASGTYQVSAQLAFIPDDAEAGEDLVVGSPVTVIELR